VTGKFEIRNTKSETNSKAETRKEEKSMQQLLACLAFSSSDLKFVSNFEFRISCF